MKHEDELSDLAQAVAPLAQRMQQLARQAEAQFSPELSELMTSGCRDHKRIEHLLDRMLDFCFDGAVLYLYRVLCQYYFPTNPRATAFYISAYREMWGEEEVRL